MTDNGLPKDEERTYLDVFSVNPDFVLPADEPGYVIALRRNSAQPEPTWYSRNGSFVPSRAQAVIVSKRFADAFVASRMQFHAGEGGQAPGHGVSMTIHPAVETRAAAADE